MAQQPNIARTSAPASSSPVDAPHWVPTRPGEITTPDEAVTGPGFGVQGPDIGYAFKLVRAADFDRCGRTSILEEVLVNLVGARSGTIGRGPTMGDVDVALALLGAGNVRSGAKSRLAHLLDHTAHEARRGMSFVNSLPRDLLVGTVAKAEAFVDSELG